MTWARHETAAAYVGVLTLRYATLTDKGVANLRRLDRLFFLDLSDTRVTDKGLAHLKGLPILQRLHFPAVFFVQTASVGVTTGKEHMTWDQLKQAEATGTPTDLNAPPTQRDMHKGFVYRIVPHVTLKSIANNPDIKEGMTREGIDKAIARHAENETLYDQPYEDKSIVRVTEPLTVESLSPHWSLPAPEQPQAQTAPKPGNFLTMILDNLRKAGVKGTEACSFG